MFVSCSSKVNPANQPHAGAPEAASRATAVSFLPKPAEGGPRACGAWSRTKSTICATQAAWLKADKCRCTDAYADTCVAPQALAHPHTYTSMRMQHYFFPNQLKEDQELLDLELPDRELDLLEDDDDFLLDDDDFLLFFFGFFFGFSSS